MNLFGNEDVKKKTKYGEATFERRGEQKGARERVKCASES